MSGVLAAAAALGHPGRITIEASITATGSPSCLFTLGADGSTTASGDTPDDWLAPANTTVADLFECFFHKETGDDPDSGAALDTWHALTSSRSMIYSGGTGSGTFTVSIRRAATEVVEGTCSLSMTAS